MSLLSPPLATSRRTCAASNVVRNNRIVLPQEFPAIFKECETHEQQTAWIFKKLSESSFNEVHKLLEKQPVPKRLFVPRQIRVDGELQCAPFKVDTQPRAKSFALLLLADRMASQTLCQACTNVKSKGPAATCFQPDVKHGMGACTNCIYSGRGNLCSLRIELEAKELKKKRQAEGKPALLTEGICQAASSRELETWRSMLQDCLREAMVKEHEMRQA